MAALTGLTVGTPDNSYLSLIKFTDNLPLTASLKSLSDGQGNVLGIKISTSQISIDSPIIFSSLAASKLVYLNGSNILTTIADGTNGQVLTTNGAGGYSFTTVSGGGGGVTINTTAITGGTNGRLLYDNAGTVGELDTATYPSLTELSYVKGVTSAIQTQLNAKLGAITINSTGLTSGTAGRILFENASNQVSEAAGLTYSSGLFTVLGTTQQAKFAYDASNHLGITIGSTGSATFALTGTTPKFTFSQGAIIETLSVGLGKAAVSTNSTFGVDTLNFANTSGSDNSAFGYHALKSNTTGINNSAVGSGALEGNTGGAYNTSMGYQSLQVLTSGDGNVAIGYLAGKENSSFGNNITCNSSVLIGYKAKVNASGQTNQIVIGSDAIGLGSNTVVLGNTSITNTYLRGSISLGLNTAASAKFHVISTTEQLRLGYDASNYASFTVASNGDLTIALTGTTPTVKFSTKVQLSDVDLILGTTTGSKIGTSTSQKVAFWNKTPIVQPTTAIAVTVHTSVGGTAINDNDTFGGYTIGQMFTALINMGILA